MNLVPNGDFELGNTLFSSDYTFAGSNTDQSQYTVTATPDTWNTAFVSASDHTPGALQTQMFVGNGADTASRVWFSSAPIVVTPDTDFFFEAWVMNLCCRAGFGGTTVPTLVNPAVLSFFANDTLLGTKTTSSLGEWEPLGTNWNSGASTSVTLKLVNANLLVLGNDFAVDDIFLGTETSIPVIPEPQTYALMMAGLGLLGFAMRRRGRLGR
ncbi:MAG: PEP-CTERM sorting domain-containing protein [Pseudomonadota bacterium]|nr:PEP-CTERM sorting domain-containing protein [Pseudomonadota bacterium]